MSENSTSQNSPRRDSQRTDAIGADPQGSELNSTRRSFFWATGAALATPLAMASTDSKRDDGDASPARLTLLETLNAIRELQASYVRFVNTAARAELAMLFVDHRGAPIDDCLRALSFDSLDGRSSIEVAEDLETARATMRCTAQIEVPIEDRGTLIEMARQQGGGVVKTVESRTIEHAYVKVRGRWLIASERNSFASMTCISD